jgi:hypothetical protein
MDRRSLLISFALGAALLAGACGSDSPSSPSGNGGVAVEGVVLGESSSFVASSGATTPSAKDKKVTVKVEGTSLTVDVSANGTFELVGIPAGKFTLIFLADGIEIGRIEITAQDGSEVKIVVQVTDSAIVVVEIKVENPESPEPPGTASCAISGGKVGQGIELEGNVSSGNAASFLMAVNGGRSGSLVQVTASSASFRCIGGAKTDGDCKDSVKAGAKVHVRGTLMTCAAGAQPEVTATEVKVQKD